MQITSKLLSSVKRNTAHSLAEGQVVDRHWGLIEMCQGPRPDDCDAQRLFVA